MDPNHIKFRLVNSDLKIGKIYLVSYNNQFIRSSLFLPPPKKTPKSEHNNNEKDTKSLRFSQKKRSHLALGFGTPV